MDDVVAQVMLAGGNENLAAGDRVAAVGPGHRASLDDAQIGAAVGFGQAHGAGPLASGEFAQVGVFLLGGTVGVDRRHRAVGQAGVHAPGRVAGADHFADHQPQRARQPLATVSRISRQTVPAALDILCEGLLEACRRCHHAVVEMAALFVAAAIERGQHVLAELRAFFEDRADHVRAGVMHAETGVAGVEVEDVIDQKAHVAQGSFVLGHGGFSVSRFLQPTAGHHARQSSCRR